MTDFLLKNFEKNTNQPAIIWHETIVTYGDLLDKYDQATKFLAKSFVESGEVIALIGDFTPNTIALMLALITNKNIIVPFNYPLMDSEKIKFEIAQIEKMILVDIEEDTYSVKSENQTADHNFYEELRERNAPGLVLFTSGTSGFPKGAVHNFDKLLKKFETPRKSLRTVNFLLFDHWGGLNTLFHTVSNCGVVLALRDRKPDAVCRFIEKFEIELLPVSPSFLNLLIISEAYKNYDLSSLKLITYGTEPMPSFTLKKAKEIFPHAVFQQTYGLIELGVLRSKSKSDESLWVKIGGDGFELRVVDDILQIKADSAMLGYLNAPSPFTEDGYFITGDLVETDGEYFKILGRKSEIINVGGDKVYPQEVENIILEMDNVMEVTVYGEKNPIMGNIVCAKVMLNHKEAVSEFSKKVKSYCRGRIQKFKIPVKISIEEDVLFNDRFKKTRKFD